MTVALITGANKGLGYETARQLIERGLTVWAGSRDVARGEEAAAVLGARFVQLDVTDDASVAAALRTIEAQGEGLDVLVNNAGVSGDRTVEGVTGAAALAVFDINTIGVIRVTQAALPLLLRSENPVVVNVSSAFGSFAAVMDPQRPVSQFPNLTYSASKAAVTMLTVQYAKALPRVRFNAVEPGFTATDLTPQAKGAGQPVADGAETIVRLATIGPEGPTGTLQERGGVLPF